MDYKKLFCCKSNNKFYIWEGYIEQNEDKTFIITRNGYENGKMTTHTKEITEGKQKRSILEQAQMILQRKYEDKMNKEGYTIDKITKDNQLKSEENEFELHKFRPMLAQNTNSKKIDKINFDEVCVQPKLDGFRCIVFWSSKHNSVILMTRTGKYITFFNHIKLALEPFFKNKVHKNYILDGEIYSKEIPFQEIIGFTHKKELSKEDETKIVKIGYYIFDMFDILHQKLEFNKRYQIISKNFNKKSNTLYLVPCKSIHSKEELKSYFASCIKDNYEGVMIRYLNGYYDINKRSKFLLKYKEFKEEEFTIISGKEAEGNDKGTVIFECETPDKLTFFVRPVGTREQRIKYFNNLDKYIGKKLTVQFQEYTDDKIPRFPVGKAIREEY